MTIIKKSILRRVFLFFLLFGVLLSVVVFYLYLVDQEYVPFMVFISALVAFTLYFILVYLYEIVRPMKRILHEMKALLAGKKYKRIYTNRVDEIGILAHFFNEVTKSFERVSTEIKEGKRMLGELEIAAQLQGNILPPKNPEIEGLDIIAKTRPAVELGGDSFDFISVNDNTYIYVGDVTGHGVPSALVMTMVNTLAHTYAEISDNAYDIVVGINRQLKKRVSSTMFMTMLMLRWNNIEQKMSYVGAGHEKLLIYRAGKGKCEFQRSGGIALGMVPDNSKLIKENEISLEKDDVIVLYSDGLTEGRNIAGEMYTLKKLVDAVERFAPRYGADGIVHHIALDYSRFVQEHIQEDDVTLIAIKYVGRGMETAKAGKEISTGWSEEESSEKKKSPEKKNSKVKKK